MRIAIIGAGFFGLASAWHLLQHPKFSGAEVTVFDHKGIAAGASGTSAGLLHAYAGFKARFSWKGLEGLVSTLNLLKTASEHFQKPVYEKRGLLRIALTDVQKKYYKESSERYADLSWLSAEEVSEIHPELAAEPGLWIEHAYVVFPSMYLKGLWIACQAQGAIFENRSIQSLQELDAFDLIIAAAGAESLHIKELSLLPIHPLKGQILEFAWPSDIPPLKTAVTSQIYIIMSPDEKSCIVGSTYEREFSTTEPDIHEAKRLIFPELHALFPPLRGKEPISCRSGLRASTPMHLPLVEQISEKCWIATGLGSKGLLYHSLMAEELVKNMAV